MSIVYDAYRVEATPSVLMIQDARASGHFKDAITAITKNLNGHVEVLPCEGAWIWDPYGSLARTVMFLAQSPSAPSEIWVVASQEGDAAFKLHPHNDKPGVMQTVQYLMHNVFHIHPEDWFGNSPDAKERVRQTVRLLRSHPMLPPHVRVMGYVYDDKTHGFIEVITP